jgi:16S rRNA (cytosine1402-N4)-methyltransferase
MFKKHMKTPQQLHIPVLLDATMQLLDPKPGESYLDLTAGYGGHARAVLAKTGSPENATLVDRDLDAIRELKNQCGFANTKMLNDDFLTAVKKLQQLDQKFDLLMMDLGVSSPQLDNKERGFSFQTEAPLDMRMDRRQSLTAGDLVNKLNEKQLSEILRQFGQERPSLAAKIARAICQNRPIVTTKQLADVVAKVSPKGRAKIHPATRTFQAIRIAVNDELRLLSETLPLAIGLLNPGGRIAVISFHSLEDGIVKTQFADNSQSGFESTLRLLTKKPLMADPNELVYNPRARSAKLRVAVKI